MSSLTMDLAVHVEMFFFMFHILPSPSFHPLLSASITIYFMPTQRNTIKTYRNKYDCITHSSRTYVLCLSSYKSLKQYSIVRNMLIFPAGQALSLLFA